MEFKLWERRAKNENNYLKRKYKGYLSRELKKYELHYLSQVDGIASITERDKNEMLKNGIESPIVTIPFGINIEKLKPENKEIENNSLFHLGSMDWDPNVDAMKWFCQSVLPDLKKDDPNMSFYLAGKKSEHLIKNEQFEHAIIVGEVPSSLEFINSKDIMIVPLRSAGGMRVKIIEGLALGKPIITSSIGIEGIDALHEEHIMIANNKEEYISAIRKLKKDPHFKENLKINARKLIQEKYDRKNIIKNLELFYKDLIG